MIDLALFRDSLASEWTKLRSVRSTYWSILIAIVLGVGLSAAIAGATEHAYPQMSASDRATFDPTSTSTAGLFFAQLALGVLAVLAVSSEYSTGTIRTTVAATPQRGYVVAAKAFVLAVLSFVVATAIGFIAFFIGQAIFTGHNLNVTLSQPGVLRAVLGVGLYMAGLALLAIGLALIVRHTAGAITVLVGIVFLLPVVLGALPRSWHHNLVRFLPANAGGSITQVIYDHYTNLAPWAGFGVFLLWVALFIGVGWYLLRTRDVK
ncbi:MAG TPA: ABC transporter permease [Mycobacteriales bacterium]|nr:ABC transporter permease [Mycobacteriales bacterium]